MSCIPCLAQLNYGVVAAYSLHKVLPTYSGSAIQVIRSCDNATANIGFTSCGDLDTVALKTFVLAANPISEIASTTDAAYSLRKVRCAYAGPAIRVRSSAVGNPTLDIAFTSSGDLDTTALKTFVGSNSAFVTTWYDQSANGYHATQTTNASQPRIMNAGVIDQKNNRPSLNFDGVDDFLQNNSYSLLLNGQTPTWNAVMVPLATNGTYAAIVSWRNAGGVVNQLEFGPSSNWNTSWWSNSNFSTTNGLTVNYGSFQILTSLYNSTSNQLYLNGTLSYNNTAQTNPAAISTSPSGCASTPLIIGDDNCCGGRFIKGYLFEVVLSSTNFSTTDRQFLEWSQAQYYNVSGPVLTTLPTSPASGSVTIWYDQSGAGKHAVQATAANQPRIITAGVIVKSGLYPAINFGGFPQNLVAPLSTSSYPVSISVLANTSGSSTGGAFIKLGTDVNAGQAGIAIGVGNSGGTFDAAGTSVIGLKEWVTWNPSNPNVNYPSNLFTTTTIQQSGGGGILTYLNGTNVPLNNAASSVGASIAGSLQIGGYTNSSNRYPVVKESEVLVFASSLSSTRRILMETNQAAYNTITISNNKYTPPTTSSYQLFINGVGRESATDSVAGTRSTLGMGISIGQTASDFLKDNGDYLTYGMNCPIMFTTSTSNLPGTITQRWADDWYLNKTDVSSNNGTINFFFDFSDYGMSVLPGVAANYELLSRNTPSGAFSIVGGTTKSVVGDRVMFAVDAASIPTNFYYTIGTKNTGVSPLPIELLSFDVSCQNQKVILTWSAATQIQNDYFSIERTTDGINYETIGKIKGGGTTSERKNYSFTDDRPINGVGYYRLKQTDVNGKENTYTNVAITCESNNEGIKIYPNPNAGTFVLEGARLYSDINIYDLTGRNVFEKKQVFSKEEIILDHLHDGIYYLKVKDTNGQTILKFVIQN